MLGEEIGRGSGKIMGVRILQAVGPHISLEISLQGSGELLGIPMTTAATYRATLRADGTFHSEEGRMIGITCDGEIVRWEGFAIGKLARRSLAARLAACGSLQTASENLLRLNAMATIAEYDSARDGSCDWRLWEWR